MSDNKELTNSLPTVLDNWDTTPLHEDPAPKDISSDTSFMDNISMVAVSINLYETDKFAEPVVIFSPVN
jgi:hypothetical protein